MADTKTAPQSILDSVSAPKVAPRPKKALTGKIVKISDPEKSDSDYAMVNIYFEPTRGSSKLFPKLMFRPEMFSFGHFDVDRDYVRNEAGIARLEELKPTAKNPNNKYKDSYNFVYGLNVMPSQIRKDGKFVRFSNLNATYAIAGGTDEAFVAFLTFVAERHAALPDSSIGVFGYKEFTPQQIVNLLNEWIKAHPQEEQLVIAKQSSRNGELTENMEVDKWLGQFNDKSYTDIETRIAKSNNETDVAKKIQRGYTV